MKTINRAIGVFVEEHIAVAAVEDIKLASPVQTVGDTEGRSYFFDGVPTEEIVRKIVEVVRKVAGDHPIEAVGMGLSGLIQHGIVEESPQIPQMKGCRIQSALTQALNGKENSIKVSVLNAPDAMAAGLAAMRDDWEKVIRVWRLGNGIGFGHHPLNDCVWEGGHTVVSLDPNETYCRCGGVGHLEGVMGRRAMRLRFLDLEPEEVFEQAIAGDSRCAAFVDRWHRALAAATASCIHMDGPGKFYITGPTARFLQIDRVDRYLSEMVRLSSLQGNSLEIYDGEDDIAIIGAAVSVLRESQ